MVTLPGVRRSWHLDLIAFKNVDEIVPNNKNRYTFYLEFRKCLFALLAGRDELVCGAMVTSSSKTPTKRISGRQKDIFVFSASRGSSWCRSLQLRRCQLWDLLAPQEVLALVPSMSTSVTTMWT